MSDVRSDYPGREAANVYVCATQGPLGWVGVSSVDDDGAGATLHFTPKRARKLARKIIKAADRADADIAAER